MIPICEAIFDSKIVLESIMGRNSKNYQETIKRLEALSNKLRRQWSEMATENYGSEEIEGVAHEIVEWYKNAMIGIPFANNSKDYPLPKERTSQSIKQYIAEIYTIESSDIDIMVSLVH
jgi:hypothetical protein